MGEMAVEEGNYTDLLCGEDSSEVLLSADYSTEYASSELESSTDLYGSGCIAVLIENESRFVPGIDYAAKFKEMRLDESAREESVAWILKVRFRFITSDLLLLR